MRILCLISILCLTRYTAVAETNGVTTITKADAIKAIADFKRQPLTENGKVAAGRIIQFAEQSDDVSIRIAKPLVPWLHDKTDEKYRALLLGAYVAGNVKSQLDHGIKKDDPYSGTLVVFDVYRQIKEADKKCRIPEIEEFSELESKKKLQEHLENILRTEIKKESARKPTKS